MRRSARRLRRDARCTGVSPARVLLKPCPVRRTRISRLPTPRRPILGATLWFMAMHIPSPSVNGFHLGPVFVHYYGLMYVIGITLAIIITQRRWQRMGGDPGIVGDVALWAVPAGIIGGRIYFDITTPPYIPHPWYGGFAGWGGGLGIWGGRAPGAAAGLRRARRGRARPGAGAQA